MNTAIKLFILTFSLTCYLTLKAQVTSFAWAKTFTGAFCLPLEIVLDEDENVYTVGYFSGSMDVDPGTGVFNLTSSGNDIFISKLNKNGEFVWATKIGGTGNDGANGIAMATNGDIIITGYFENTVDFDPSSGVKEITALGNKDIFILKLNKNGEFIWANRIGGTTYEEAYDVAVDKQDNIYLTGRVTGKVDFDPGTGKYEISGSTSSTDAFVLKLKSSGVFEWAIRFGSGDNESGEQVAIDNNNDLIISGTFSGNVDFDPGANVVSRYGAGIADAFVLKLAPNSNFKWVHTITGSGFIPSLGMDVDNEGNIGLIGYFTDKIEMNPTGVSSQLVSLGAEDNYILKLNPSGSFLWASQIGGTSIDWSHDLCFDQKGDLYVTGFHYSESFFGDPSVKLTSSGIEDAYLSKFSKQGGILWAKSIGGKSSDGGYSIEIAKKGNVYCAGSFGTKADLNPEDGEQIVNASGTYIVKLNQDLLLSADDIENEHFEFFPIPCDQILKVSTPNLFEHQISNFQFYDVDGRKYPAEIHQANNVIEINTSKFKPGIYYLVYTIGKSTFTQKIPILHN